MSNNKFKNLNKKEGLGKIISDLVDKDTNPNKPSAEEIFDALNRGDLMSAAPPEDFGPED